MDLVPPDCWNHVVGADNPADCASRGLYPSEILTHHLWWSGPEWLTRDRSEWPTQLVIPQNSSSDEINELCFLVCAAVEEKDPLLPIDRFSTFSRLSRVTAWVLRFIRNCRARRLRIRRDSRPLSVEELDEATAYWIKLTQVTFWCREIESLKKNRKIAQTSSLLSLHPMLDELGVVCVGGRQQNAKFSYNSRHPIIFSSKHPVVKLLIRSEHVHLLHGGPLLVSASLSRRFHIVGGHKAIRSVTRSCITCRRRSAKPKPQIMGQLPVQRVTPDAVFSKVGLDYAGPVYVKQSPTRRPTLLKTYICVFVSLSVKAVHLEAVTDLTSEAFLACLRRFIARRGKAKLIWSNHGTNFVGANRLIKELFDFLKQKSTNDVISDFCSLQGINWEFIPEHSPHFGGLWESAVWILKTHLRRVVGNTKLTYEELSTVLAQVEACMNSHPLGVNPHNDDDGIEVLTPGHFLI